MTVWIFTVKSRPKRITAGSQCRLELLDHKDVITIMIYTHFLNCRPKVVRRSPLAEVKQFLPSPWDKPISIAIL